MKLHHLSLPKALRLHVPHTEREFVIEVALLIKVMIAVGIVMSYVLPEFHAKAVGMLTGIVWLLRD